jgi:hypothetical protein
MACQFYARSVRQQFPSNTGLRFSRETAVTTVGKFQMLRSLCVIDTNFTSLRHFLLKLWRKEILQYFIPTLYIARYLILPGIRMSTFPSQSLTPDVSSKFWHQIDRVQCSAVSNRQWSTEMPQAIMGCLGCMHRPMAGHKNDLIIQTELELGIIS